MGLTVWKTVCCKRPPYGEDVPNEASVLEVLDANLPETSLYLVPGHSLPDSLFLTPLVAPLIPAWILFGICRGVAPRFVGRVTFVGLVLAWRIKPVH